MIFRIHNRSGVPVYLQLVQQVKEDIQLGLLKEGDQLPAVREVVTMIAINPNTVVKAYRELENQGLIEKRPGIGTFVAEQASKPPLDAQTALLEKLDAWMSEAEAGGFDEEGAEALFNKTLQRRRDAQEGVSDARR